MGVERYFRHDPALQQVGENGGLLSRQPIFRGRPLDSAGEAESGLGSGFAPPQREVRALSSRFGNSGVRWESNLDYVVLPNGRPIEGLFPDQWIVDAFAEEPNWFDEPPTHDVEGTLLGFGIRRRSARAVRERLQARGEEEPGSLVRIVSVLEAIEAGLDRSAGSLEASL